MSDVAVSPDALRGDARWARHAALQIADEVDETSWPPVRLDGSATAAATGTGPPGLSRLAAGLEVWANGVTAAADDLDDADHAAAHGFSG